jgi:sortase A
MPDRCQRPIGRRASLPLRWLERLFLAFGMAALIWCAVVLADGAIAQRNGRYALEIASAVDEFTRARAETVDVRPRHQRVEVGSAIAALSIPRVQLSTIVLHGTDAQTLRRGPGHLDYTALPGEDGNVVIAGHRDSFFRPLRNIRVDDDIFLDTVGGQFHYRVTSIHVVGPRDVSVLAATSEQVLTLITCYPFWVLGHAPDRFIVRAARVDGSGPPIVEARSLPARGWLPAPAFHIPAHHVVALPAVAVARDDETLVRQKVQRYLSVRGVRSGACAISITGDRASASCERAAQSSDDEPGRVFALERENQAWSIRSIELTGQTSPRDSQEQP